MWQTARPECTAQRAYVTTISRVRNGELKERFARIERDIVKAEHSFELAMLSTELHKLKTSDVVGGLVSAQEMERLYTNRMAKKGAPGRRIYDNIIASPKHGLCPLCGHRAVSTLDHHLPKALYPDLAVTPLNLVPSCTDCNKAKLDASPATKTDQTLHPYFDNVDAQRWLRAEVLQRPSAVVRYFVDTSTIADQVLAQRVQHHFKLLGLAKLYASQGAEELLNVQAELASVLSAAGPTGVKKHLSERARSCASVRTNSWRTATYSALSESVWYCSGGVLLNEI